MTKSNAQQDSAVKKSLFARCPNCGEGALFEGVLSVAESCNECEQSFDFEDSGDGPTVFVIMILGFLMAGLMLYAEFALGFSWWMHLIVWTIFILVVGIWMLRFAKALLITIQFEKDAKQGVVATRSNAKDKK